jgi:outer membrane lipoprotein SlyB
MNVQTGKVLDIQETQIEVQASASSQAFGGVVGGLVGALVGSKESSNVGQSLAAAVGAFGGSQIAKHISQEMRWAQQVTVQLRNGNVVALVQEPNGSPLGVGDSVALVGSYPAVRVVKAAWAN